MDNISLERRHGQSQTSSLRRNVIRSDNKAPSTEVIQVHEEPIVTIQASRLEVSKHSIPVKVGLILIGVFFTLFAVFLSLRSTIRPPPILLALVPRRNNHFRWCPVVIPLLCVYVVEPGWVSPRDFLLGLAVIQAMPGPNLNFAVYLGSLVAIGPAAPSSTSSVVGAILGFLGIFTPGLWLSIGFQSIWQSLRKRREVTSILWDLNATAVGFIFTAVYRLWEIGYLTAQPSKGSSLGQELWWLVVAATTFTTVEWFSVPPPVAILGGGTAGVAWWGAVGRRFM